jgi:hypothetical protein
MIAMPIGIVTRADLDSGLYRFFVVSVLLPLKAIPQGGPLQWRWISRYSIFSFGDMGQEPV